MASSKNQYNFMNTELFFSRDAALVPTGQPLYPAGGEPTVFTPTGTPIVPYTAPSTGDVGNTAATMTFEQPATGEAPVVQILSIPPRVVKGSSTGDIAEQTGTIKPAEQLQPIKGSPIAEPTPPAATAKNDLSLNKSPYYNYFKILLVIFIIIILYRVFK
jgi:hypothetical protein